MKWLRLTLQILLPVIVLGGGYWLATGILANKQQPTVSADTFVGPLVNTHVAAAEDIRIDVRTQGTVEPHREIDLSAQVGGRVITVSPALRAGGFFAAGELLLEIDRADYELAVVQQEENHVQEISFAFAYRVARVSADGPLQFRYRS